MRRPFMVRHRNRVWRIDNMKRWNENDRAGFVLPHVATALYVRICDEWMVPGLELLPVAPDVAAKLNQLPEVP